jgi:hypothetical protein
LRISISMNPNGIDARPQSLPRSCASGWHLRQHIFMVNARSLSARKRVKVGREAADPK